MGIGSLPVFREDGTLRQQHVYVLVCKDTAGAFFMKVGRTLNPQSRLSGILNGCPIEPVAFYFAGVTWDRVQKLETTIHRELAELRIRREWFKCETEEPLTEKRVRRGIRVAMRLLRVASLEWTAVDLDAFRERQAAVAAIMRRKAAMNGGSIERKEPFVSRAKMRRHAPDRQAARDFLLAARNK